eukprot:m.91915 g.91915  ORF g.91915 m.91915 type:complete len:388 (-) comp14650_c0_seq3:57-1220(-)
MLKTRGQAQRAALMMMAKRRGDAAKVSANSQADTTLSSQEEGLSSKRARRKPRQHLPVKYEEVEPDLTELKSASEIKQEIKTEDSETDPAGQSRDQDSSDMKPTARSKEPPNWRAVYDNIVHMRRNRDAPVDTLGCEVLADPSTDEATQRFHVLVALMLSSQTKDELTAKAVRALQQLPGGLTAQTILDTETSVIEQSIYGVGFWRRKAQYLKGAAAMILSDFKGDIPQTTADLVKLPGVGMKMATIAMAVANKNISGIGVDTHVHRISNRLRWVKNTKSPEQTQVELEKWMPRSIWGAVNVLLVGFGQTICTPRAPKCGECLNKDLCPSSTAKTRPRRQPPAAKIEELKANEQARSTSCKEETTEETTKDEKKETKKNNRRTKKKQ